MPEVSKEDELISQQLQKLAKKIQDELDLIAERRVGFCLVVFQTEDNSATSYVSNCDRTEVVAALEDLLEFWKSGGPAIPAHELNRKLN